MKEIATKRLVLRPLSGGDRDVIVQLLDDIDVSRWLTVVPHPYTPADFDAFLNFLAEGAKFEGLAIQAKEGVVGVIGIGDTLGYWLGAAYQNKGYMTEAAGALVDWFFQNTDAQLLGSGYFEGNTASFGVLKKLGFAPTGVIVSEYSQAQGVEVPLIKVNLSRDDWRRLK